MNFEELFKKNQQKKILVPDEQFDIEQNSMSIIYKYHDDKDHIVKSKPIYEPGKSKPKCEELSKTTLSPNRPEDTNTIFQQYRCKSNVLYEFENYLVYNKLLGEGSFSRVYLG